jgi:hypothetical protein
MSGTHDASELVRLYAFVKAQALDRRVHHYLGFPAELADGQSDQALLAWPEVLVIDEESPGNVSLYRLTSSGDPAGDTWHKSVEDAFEQVAYEYGELAGPWKEIPSGVADAFDYAIRAAQEHGSS